MGNNNLSQARLNKKDEFYTRLEDIEYEMEHYKNYFKDKVVYCNCDLPYESNFFNYFVINFNRLGIKKLITTSYKYSQIKDKRLEEGVAYCTEITKVNNGLENIFNDNKLYRLKGDGDFRSEECLNILSQADIVVSNPPFSLFKEYLSILINNNKDFLIVGNQNAVTYKEIFPYFKEDRIWLGNGFPNSVGYFQSPYDDYATSNQKIEGLIRVAGVVWITNLDHDNRYKDLSLTKKYDPNTYSKFDDFNAINIDRTKDIPKDYKGVMGVPISFIHKYNPRQFKMLSLQRGHVNGKKKYVRIFIKHRGDYEKDK